MENNIEAEITACEWRNEALFSEFISKNYIKVNPKVSSGSGNPIFPFKIDYHSNNPRLTFCKTPTVESWLIKKDTLFTFFVMVKKDMVVIDSISAQFGPHDLESSVEIQSNSQPTTYIWQKGVKIYLSEFANVWDVPKYRDCSLIIFGNMNFKDILHSGD